jgi:hypothetical protein
LHPDGFSQGSGGTLAWRIAFCNISEKGAPALAIIEIRRPGRERHIDHDLQSNGERPDVATARRTNVASHRLLLAD